MPINYDLKKIKFGTDAATFERAVGLYENGKVTKFKNEIGEFSAIVIGTEPYEVSVSAKYFDQGGCSCYLGQQDILCKHMIAVAIRAVSGGKPLKEEERQPAGGPVCSGRLGILNAEELAEIKKNISDAVKYIKSYDGPSRIWFQYQNSLEEGRNRLSAIVSDLPVSEQTSELLVKLLLRLDKKLCESGVDDSNGTVGGFIENVVTVLQKYSELEKACLRTFNILKNQETCFGWEEPLLKLIEK